MRLVPPDSQETYGRGADAERASSAAGELVHLAENQGQLDPPLAPSPRPRTGRGGPSSVRFFSPATPPWSSEPTAAAAMEGLLTAGARQDHRVHLPGTRCSNAMELVEVAPPSSLSHALAAPSSRGWIVSFLQQQVNYHEFWVLISAAAHRLGKVVPSELIVIYLMCKWFQVQLKVSFMGDCRQDQCLPVRLHRAILQVLKSHLDNSSNIVNEGQEFSSPLLEVHFEQLGRGADDELTNKADSIFRFTFLP